MAPETFAAALAATAAYAVVPGPCTVLTANRTGVAGLAAGLRVTLGVAIAKLLLVAGTYATAGGLLSLSPEAAERLRWVGILVLTLMALHLLRSARRDAAAVIRVARHQSTARRPRAHRMDIVGGLVVGLATPYNLGFLLGVAPQLGAGGTLSWQAHAVLGAFFVAGMVHQAGAILLGLGSRRLGPRGARGLAYAGASLILGFAALSAFGPGA